MLADEQRQMLVTFYCENNRVSADLAEYWVDQMTDAEVAEELRLRRDK